MMNDIKKSFHHKIDLMVIVMFAVMISVYLWHVMSQSQHIMHIVLVFPCAAAAIVLCILEFILLLKKGSAEVVVSDPVWPAVKIMLLFIGYVLLLPVLGLDVGTALFISIFLYMNGERRLMRAVSYGGVFGFLVAWAFSALLPYAMPMLIIPTL